MCLMPANGGRVKLELTRPVTQPHPDRMCKELRTRLNVGRASFPMPLYRPLIVAKQKSYI